MNATEQSSERAPLIFYPLLTQDYADSIVFNRNSTEPEHTNVGITTRFQIRNEFVCKHKIQTAADKSPLKYGIPAKDLDSFKENIVGKIAVVAEFRKGKLVPTTSI